MKSGKPVLHGISFESKPGTVTALVGIFRFGQVDDHLADLRLPYGKWWSNPGMTMASILRRLRLSSYREQLGVVLQETFLFDGTIRENVLFSRPSATHEQLMEACRIARVDEFAERFPEAYETIVGERGVKAFGRAAAEDLDRKGDPCGPAGF